MTDEKGKRVLGVVLFWVAALVPFAVIFMNFDRLTAWWAISLLLIYALFYRPLLHVLLLLHLKAIDQKDVWKFFLIPFYGSKYMKVLWFG
jgi:hypothetical protein